MVEIVDAAEALGYGVLSVSLGSITLGASRNEEITISGVFVDAAALRRILRPVERKEAEPFRLDGTRALVP